MMRVREDFEHSGGIVKRSVCGAVDEFVAQREEERRRREEAAIVQANARKQAFKNQGGFRRNTLFATSSNSGQSSHNVTGEPKRQNKLNFSVDFSHISGQKRNSSNLVTPDLFSPEAKRDTSPFRKSQ